VMYKPPDTSLSSDYQRTISAAVESTLNKISFDLKGKTVSLEVSLIADNKNSKGIQEYVAGYLEEKIIISGGKIVSQGDISVAVFISSVGDITTMRILYIPIGSSYRIPLYYSEATKGIFDMILIIKDKENNILKFVTNRGDVKLKDTYLFKFFGPFDIGL